MNPKNITVLYLDFQTVGDEIKEIIKNEHLGELIFKKQKLFAYHKGIYESLGFNHFIHLNNNQQLKDLVHRMKSSDGGMFVVHHSSVAVIDQEKFGLFIEKMVLLNQSICLSDFSETKPLFFDSSIGLKSFFEAITDFGKPFEEVFSEYSSDIECLRKETFYTHIKDLGSLIQFLHSNFEARHFNQIEKDELTITKKSNKIDKIKAEFEYYHHVPNELKSFFLPTFDFRTSDNQASYKLEKLNVPDMAMLWVHGAVKPHEFKTFLKRVFLFLKRRPLRNVNTDFFQNESISNELYLNKLKTRVEEFSKMPEFSKINHLLKNHSELGGIEECVENYEKKLKDLIQEKKYKPRNAFSHGDLCFSNMLYDKRTQLLKLIDPRGAKDPDDLYMDMYYDLAKLSHSVLGNYDFINSGLFEFKTNTQLAFDLEIQTAENLDSLKEIFIEELKNEGFDLKLVRIFEASLFLSMLPLHIDNPKKVLAFALNAQLILKTL
ncbi:MAG: hypothetical protein SNJ77_12795 [Cytophagales bacterium]